jgi:hypothetical protein
MKTVMALLGALAGFIAGTFYGATSEAVKLSLAEARTSKGDPFSGSPETVE